MSCSRLLGLVVGLASIVVLLVGGIAAAGRFSISSRTFRQTYESAEFETELGTIRCPLTLEGSFHSSTIRKVAEANIGAISRASLPGASCTGGAATVEAEALPWTYQYASYEGTLPNITRSIRAAFGAVIRLPIMFMSCRYRATALGVEPATAFGIRLIRDAVGRITAVVFTGTVTLDPAGQTGCPPVPIAVTPSGRETVLGSTASITVTLI